MTLLSQPNSEPPLHRESLPSQPIMPASHNTGYRNCACHWTLLCHVVPLPTGQQIRLHSSCYAYRSEQLNTIPYSGHRVLEYLVRQQPEQYPRIIRATNTTSRLRPLFSGETSSSTSNTPETNRTVLRFQQDTHILARDKFVNTLSNTVITIKYSHK